MILLLQYCFITLWLLFMETALSGVVKGAVILSCQVQGLHPATSRICFSVSRAERYNKIVTWTLDMICPIGAWNRLFMPRCSVMCSRYSIAVMLVVYSMHISVKWINSYLIVFCENTISLKQLRQEHSLSSKEQKRVRDFLYHGYLSCDFRECKRVGKSLGAITLWVHKKITKKNTGKPWNVLRDWIAYW